jgi:hypothetical protein
MAHPLGGVPVERHPCPVIAHRLSRVGVTRGLLDVSERDVRVEGGGNEPMAERVRVDGLVDPGFAGEAANDPPGGVTVQPSSGSADKDRILSRRR